MAIFVCLTAGEWKNLCSVGHIRIHLGRTIPQPEVALNNQNFSLFSTSPDRFAIGESSDLIVAELIDCWSATRDFYPDNLEGDMQWLTLENVISFSPVQNKDKWVFESDAERIGVRLSDARFEELWFSWVKEDSFRAAAINGGKLINICGFNDSNSIEFDGISYRDMSRLAVSPGVMEFQNYCLLQNLLKYKEVLHDSCREDLDTCAFFISCAVEWANFCAGGNVLESNPVIESAASELYGKLREVPWNFSVIADPVVSHFLNELAGSAPASFSGSCKPRTISLYIRYSHQIRFGKTLPDEILGAVKTAEVFDGHDSGRLLAFLLGVALGGGRVQSLARQIPNNPYSVALPLPISLEPQSEREPVPNESLQGFENATTTSNVISSFLPIHDHEGHQANCINKDSAEWLEVLSSDSVELLDRLLAWAGLTDYFHDHKDVLKSVDLVKEVIKMCPSARLHSDTRSSEILGNGGVWCSITTNDPKLLRRELLECIEECVRAGHSPSVRSEPLVQVSCPTNFPAPPPEIGSSDPSK